MRKRTSLMLACLTMATLSANVMAADAKKDTPSPMAAEQTKPAVKEITGKDLAFDNKKGNCLACHAMPNVKDAISAGNIAPPLISMKARYPDRAKLRAQIWDATQANEHTSMPPFGKHKVLTEHEIDLVTDYIHSL